MMFMENIATHFLDRVCAGSHNVYKGDINLILGLIWTLIQKYQLQMEGEIFPALRMYTTPIYMYNLSTCGP